MGIKPWFICPNFLHKWAFNISSSFLLFCLLDVSYLNTWLTNLLGHYLRASSSLFLLSGLCSKIFHWGAVWDSRDLGPFWDIAVDPCWCISLVKMLVCLCWCTQPSSSGSTGCFHLHTQRAVKAPSCSDPDTPLSIFPEPASSPETAPWHDHYLGVHLWQAPFVNIASGD